MNALALVAAHPEQVATLVAHEPPLAGILPDAEGALAVCRAVHDAYEAHGFGVGMARFILAVSHQGPMTLELASQPDPDPAMFGLPAEDDGNRTDALLGQNIVSCTGYQPDFDALRAALDPDRHRRGHRVQGPARQPRGVRRRRAARHRARDLPQRPRRLPRRRVRPEGRSRRVRREAPRGARRGLTPLRRHPRHPRRRRSISSGASVSRSPCGPRTSGAFQVAAGGAVGQVPDGPGRRDRECCDIK